ncbi:MAG: hypothetical protein WDA13_00005 [Candidatus Shapirobacteria bacterium]
MASKELGEISDRNFTREGLKKLAEEINIPLQEIHQELKIPNEKVVLFFSAEEIINNSHPFSIKKLFGHNYSPEDISFFHKSAPVISDAIHERKRASSPKESMAALEKLDQILIEKSETAKTVYQLSTLYYTAPAGSKARKLILEKIYKLLNQ